MCDRCEENPSCQSSPTTLFEADPSRLHKPGQLVVVGGPLGSSTTQMTSQCRKQKYIVIELLLTNQGCRTDSGAELQPRTRAFVSIRTTNICAKLQLSFHQSGFRDQGLLGTFLCGTFTLFSLVGSPKCGGAARPPFMSQPANQDVSDVSYPGRSGELKL